MNWAGAPHSRVLEIEAGQCRRLQSRLQTRSGTCSRPARTVAKLLMGCHRYEPHDTALKYELYRAQHGRRWPAKSPPQCGTCRATLWQCE